MCRRTEAGAQWTKLAKILQANAPRGRGSPLHNRRPRRAKQRLKYPQNSAATHNLNKSLLKHTLTLHVENF